MIKDIITIQEKSMAGKIEFSSWKFPAGEIGFRITDPKSLENVRGVCIESRLTNSDSFFELALAINALHTIDPSLIVTAHLPYLPYERQDRVCTEGESFSLEVFANMMETLNLDLATTLEPHSEKSMELFPSYVKELDALFVMGESISEIINENTVFVAPDFGARERVTEVARSFGMDDKVFFAKKIRELSTGKITHLELEGDFAGKEIIIYDDLVDGGKTFIELAKLLKEKNVRKSHLVTVHGLFTKGVEELSNLYDTVITTNSYRDFSDVILPDNFKVIDVMDIENL
jgi:ribose-phosphate pyrophosphokinase